MDKKERMLDFDEAGVWVRVLTVDPGIAGTGWAYWPMINRPTVSPREPECTDVIFHAKGVTGERGADDVCSQFREVVTQFHPEHVVIEFDFQCIWSSNAASRASAAKGDLFKLTYLVGGFGEIVRSITGEPPILVAPWEWKGQLPKPAIDSRIKMAINESYRNHESDAVGIGLCLQGALL